MSNNAANSRYEDRAVFTDAVQTLAERGTALIAEITQHRKEAEEAIAEAVADANVKFQVATGLTFRSVRVEMAEVTAFGEECERFDVGAIDIIAAEFGGAR